MARALCVLNFFRTTDVKLSSVTVGTMILTEFEQN